MQCGLPFMDCCRERKREGVGAEEREGEKVKARGRKGMGREREGAGWRAEGYISQKAKEI